MFVLRAASAAAWMAVNGGATTISTPATSLTALRSSFTKSKVSCTVLNIFQLPAMNGALICRSLVSQGGDARQRAAAEELERRAAAGRDVRDLVGDASFLHRGDRVSAADDRRSVHGRDGARHRVGS